MRFEAHGRELARTWTTSLTGCASSPRTASRARSPAGAQLSGSEVGRSYDGVLEMHRHFLESARTGRPATSSLKDALQTMRLVQRIERAEH